MDLNKYYNRVVKHYTDEGITELEMLRFVNTNNRNYTKILNKVVNELKTDDVNFSDTDIDRGVKKILQQRISYYNDIKKPTNENNMKTKNLLSPSEFNKIYEATNKGTKSLDREISWLNGLLEDKDTLDEKLKKFLGSSKDGQKTYLRSIALDQAGKTKWALKFSVKAEELGYSIKDNESPTDIKNLVSGATKTKTGTTNLHINMGEPEGKQMPYNGKLGNEYDNTPDKKTKKSKNEGYLLSYADFCKSSLNENADEDNRIELKKSKFSSTKSLPSNVSDWLKRDGSHVATLAKQAASWLYAITGRNFTGGTSIGKSPQTLILDITHQGSEVYIKNDIEVLGEIVNSKKEFEEALKTKFKLPSEIKENLENEFGESEPLAFRIPTWALTAIVNNDIDTLNEEEEVKLDKFLNALVAEYGNAHLMLGDEDDKLGFCHSNDIDNLGCDCETMYLIPTPGCNYYHKQFTKKDEPKAKKLI